MIVLLILIFLSQLAYAQTLPERLTAETVMNYIRTNEVSSVEELIAALPPLHRRHFALVFESGGLNSDFVSGDHPRVVSWGGDSRFLIAWSTHPDSPGKNQVEFLQHGLRKWTAGVIDFSEDTPKLSNPTECSNCHGDLNKPLWGNYPIWAGTEVDNVSMNSEETTQFIKSALNSDNPRLDLLESNPVSRDVRTIQVTSSVSGKTTTISNIADELGATLVWRHAEVLFNRFKARDNYRELAKKCLCRPRSGVVPADSISFQSLFGPQESNISLMKTGGFIQGSSESPSPYGSANGNIENAFIFLTIHDFRQRDERIYRLYKSLSNEEYISRDHVRVSSYEVLHFPRGEATAEEEFLETYRQHFETEGQDSLDARTDIGILLKRFNKTFQSAMSSLPAMLPRVCEELSQPEPVPPPPPTNRGGGGGGGGGGGPPQSSDASLSSLKIQIQDQEVSLDLDPDTDNYTVNVYGVNSVTLIPTANHADAEITVNGKREKSGEDISIDLNDGETSIEIEVTAEDKTTRTYTLTVISCPREEKKSLGEGFRSDCPDDDTQPDDMASARGGGGGCAVGASPARMEAFALLAAIFILLAVSRGLRAHSD